MEITELMGLSTNNYSEGASAQELGKDDFMRLLVTQLQNQDPFQPMENAEFVSQLAQFSTLEQTQNMSDGLNTLALLQQESMQLQNLTEASTLIGKDVVFYDTNSGEELSGLVESVEVLNGSIYLKIGENHVPLALVLEVSAPPEE